MTHELIDSAIQQHQAWITHFEAEVALAGQGKSEQDIASVRDDTACALGNWLLSEESLMALGPEYLSRTMALHGTFHEVALASTEGSLSLVM